MIALLDTEDSIVWLEDVSGRVYLRELHLISKSRSRPVGPNALRGGNPRLRVVGYTILKRDTPAYFTEPRSRWFRRVFALDAVDHGEPKAAEVYATGRLRPIEAKRPRDRNGS